MTNVVGMKFGRLTVIDMLGYDHTHHEMCLCECECGTRKEFYVSNLKSGSSKSCGCLMAQRKKAKPRNRWTVDGRNRNWQPNGSIEDLDDLVKW